MVSQSLKDSDPRQRSWGLTQRHGRTGDGCGRVGMGGGSEDRGREDGAQAPEPAWFTSLGTGYQVIRCPVYGSVSHQQPGPNAWALEEVAYPFLAVSSKDWE